MSANADFSFDAEHARLSLRGPWVLARLGELAERVHARPPRLPHAALTIDARELAALDTAGATLLLRALRATGQAWDAHTFEHLAEPDAALLRLVASRASETTLEPRHHRAFSDLLARLGASVLGWGDQTREFLGFVGLTLSTLLGVLTGRRKLRWTATVYHMEQTGLDAVPIVGLLSFLVGAVVAFLGATVLADFGAAIFTVELVSYSFLREFGVLLTAILLAGRSGSTFTAQIGSMKSHEELDAIQALGLDPIELLVIPRMLALLLMLPVLTFLAMVAGIIGGGLVGTMALDITPGMFISRLHELTEARHFWVGMAKAPVFAFLIATVGCLQGFKVEGSAESVGRHTTTSVVQSIFLVILFDALFAIFFMELDV